MQPSRTTSARTRCFRSVCNATKKLADATHEAERAIGIDPEVPLGFYALAVAMYRRNRDEEARTAIEGAIALERTDPDYHALLAQLYLRKSLWRMALHAADEGLVFDPRHSGCLNSRATALVNLGEREAAAATMKDALQNDPEDGWLHANRGWSLLHEGKPREAMTHFREALRLEPENQWARAGVVESLKASFFLYRWLLRYFLFMSRLSPRTQQAVVFGGFIGYQVLRALSRNFPALAPYVLPLIVAYVAFALLTWLASALLNLLLRLHPIGKYALTTADRRTSELVGCLLLGTIVCGVLAATTIYPVTFFTLALACFATSLPASHIFYAAYGWPRWAMVCVALTVLGAGAYASVNLGDQPFFNFVIATLVSQFAAMYLVRVRPRR